MFVYEVIVSNIGLGYLSMCLSVCLLSLLSVAVKLFCRRLRLKAMFHRRLAIGGAVGPVR